MRKILLATSSLILLSATAASASEPMSMEQMQKQLEMLSAQVQKMSAKMEDQDKTIAAQKMQISEQTSKLEQQNQKVSMQSQTIEKMAAIAPAAGNAVKADDGVKITMNPVPKISSADGKYTFSPIARVHADVVAFDDDKREQPSGANLRRARLGFKGDLGQDFNYKVEVDFGGEATNLKDVYLAYTGWDFAEIWGGNFKAPVGLEQNTSTNYMSFMENSPATTAFTRDEILGAALKGGGENWGWQAGVFNDDAGVNNATDDEALSFDARASVDLLQDSPNVLHLGLGGSYRKPNAATESVTLSGKPAGTGPNEITTGAIANVDTAYVWAPELAGVFGPFAFQAEYFHESLKRDSGSDPDFSGYYGQVSYLLTGETRPYKGKTGTFDRIKPAHPLNGDGWGAFEVLGRYDNLDLNDVSEGVAGGEMHNWTAGLNWYMTNNIRMMFNYEKVNTDNNAVVANDDPSLVSARLQWDF